MNKHLIDQQRLSSQASLRREQMLTELKSELHRATARRRQRIAGFWLGAVAILLATRAWTLHWASDPASLVVEKTSQPPGAAVEIPSTHYSHVTLETISDDELLYALASLGQPSVLGEISGETLVISQKQP